MPPLSVVERLATAAGQTPRRAVSVFWLGPLSNIGPRTPQAGESLPSIDGVREIEYSQTRLAV